MMPMIITFLPSSGPGVRTPGLTNTRRTGYTNAFTSAFAPLERSHRVRLAGVVREANVASVPDPGWRSDFNRFPGHLVVAGDFAKWARGDSAPLLSQSRATLTAQLFALALKTLTRFLNVPALTGSSRSTNRLLFTHC